MHKLLFALAAALTVAAQDSRNFERGFPPVDVHPLSRHDGGSQVFSVAQGTNGILYFGTLRGVTSYDGAWWRTFPLPNNSAVFAVATGQGPEIAVGAVGEIGWFTPQTDGALVYRSLIGTLPAEHRDVGDTRSICATRNGFVFASENSIIEWTGGVPRVLADLRGRNETPRCFQTTHATWIALGDGLHRVDGATLLRSGFENRQVDLVLPFDDRRVLVSVAKEGIFLSDGRDATPFAPDASAWLRDKIVRTGCRLLDGRFVIGTRAHGITIIDATGAAPEWLGSAAGLPDDVLSGAMPDREGALWLTYYGPIARVDLATPVTRIDQRRGLAGSPAAVARHRDALYVATSHGLFKTDRNTASGADPSHAFREVAGVPPAWKPLSVDDELLVATGEGVYVLDANDHARRIEGTETFVVYGALRSERDRSRVWISTKNAVGTLRRRDGTWRFETLIDGSPRYGRQMFEQDGVLWVSTIFDGVVRIEPRGETFRIESFGKGEANAMLIGGRIGAAGLGVLLRIRGRELEPDPHFSTIAGSFFHAQEDARGNLWINNDPPAVIRRLPDGNYAREAMPIPMTDATNAQMMEIVDDVIWWGGNEGLFRYDFRDVRGASRPPRPLIRRAVLADGSIVHAPLRYAFGRLTFEFAPASFRPGTQYQSRLEPADEEWSAWSREPSIDYTNLDAGEYTLHVRARGAGGEVSEETQWTFEVLPPWYRASWAMVLWSVLAALLVAAIVWLRTTALRRQAARLRILVDERTEELQQANAHLERLSLLDELTGIANRRYFQRALVEDWRMGFEERHAVALVLLDLDKFKDINDRYGHAAGDAALVQVGRALGRHMRRSGELGARVNDLVARIGGEEFALLLARTSEEEALTVAERVRVLIEELPVEFDGQLLRVTASCGLAVMVPPNADRWNAILTEADRALYAAKADGRNCVRVASEGNAGVVAG